MQNFHNTVGFITGGASGIGLAVARALGERGMALMLADIEADTLDRAAAELRDERIQVETVVLDVSDYDAYQAAARRTLEHFGKVNFLFNNAGVASHALAGSTPIEDWRWLVEVNLMGVVYGVEAFLPSMRELDEACYIVNTASIAGIIATPGLGPYTATKFAVVGYSDALRVELAESNVGVSVLCPAWVKTQIAQSRRNHPGGGDAGEADGDMGGVNEIIAEQGIDVSVVADRVLDAMDRHTFHIFTHPDFWPLVQSKLDGVRNDYHQLF